MPLLPYCVFSTGLALPQIVTGVQEAPVLRLDAEGLSVLYSEVTTLPQDRGELAQAAMSFQSTVQQVFGAGIVIAFRFPTQLAGVDELQTHLRENGARYRAGLMQLNGMAQMEVRLTQLGGSTSPASTAPTTGTEYLKARQAESQGITAAEDALKQAAGTLVHEWRLREGAGVRRLYGLIPHDKAAEFKRLIGFVRLSGGTRAVISGPWPPSEFLPEKA
jgi:hypothetical protein